MATRKAHARWEGSVKDGKGQVDFGNGAFTSAYSFDSRFEDGKGTNPEELLGAAHASCFAMALSLVLGGAGFKPGYIDATAHVMILPEDGRFRITKSHLVCEAAVKPSSGYTCSRRGVKHLSIPIARGLHLPGPKRSRKSPSTA